MSKCKVKAIHTDLSTFRNIQAYPGINQTYSESWYIQNPRIFRVLIFSKSEAYSEPCQTSTMKRSAEIVNGCNYFRSISLPCSLPHEINIMR